MADLVTLLTLRTKARERADMIGSQFVTDSELNGYIANSYKHLYDLLVDAVEDYNLLSASFTISTGNTFNLPATFYKLRGLDDLTDSSNPRTVRKFMFAERNDYLAVDRMSWAPEFSDVMYRIEGNTVAILPPERAKKTFSLWYVPTPTIPVADGDTVDVINGFDEFIIVDAAIKCLIKEESDTRALERIKSEQLSRIETMKKNRDQNLPEKVSRVRTRRRSGMDPYSGYFSQ
jgi:hypothetical protein